MFRGLSRTRLAALLFGVLLVASEASARSEQLRWTHGNPTTVSGFKVFWRLSSSSTQTEVAAGLPTVQNGAYTFNVTVPDAGDVYFSVRAYNTGGDSPASNEICRGPGVACGTTPPPPPPPPPPTGSPVSGFRLLNATTDQVLDTDFQNGETITTSCWAIEIVASGSLSKSLDGTQGTCENSSPYGWYDGGATGFECAPALANGSHTLTVTPYSGYGCTGTALAPVTRTFTVNVSGTPPPPPPPAGLGAPGKPYIVQ
jgi:hypothetical protein